MSARSGRIQTCPTCRARPRVCHSCGARIEWGQPKAESTWTSELVLSRKQFDMLLTAAAEFREHNAECYRCHHGPHGRSCDPESTDDCTCSDYVPSGEDDPVPFLDWIRPDVVDERQAA